MGDIVLGAYINNTSKATAKTLDIADGFVLIERTSGKMKGRQERIAIPYFLRNWTLAA